MAMTKLKLAAGAIVIAALGTSLVLEQHAQARLRQDNQALRLELDRSTRLSAENQRLASLTDTAARRESPLDELTRLRAEAARLRQQQGQLASIRAIQTAPHSPAPASDYLLKGAYTNAGFTDPDSTLQTMMWAGTTHDAATILACFAPEAGQSEIRTEAQQKQSVEVVSRSTSRWSGYRVLDHQNFGDDRMVTTVSFRTADGESVLCRAKLRRIGSEWKFDGELGADTELKPGQIRWGDGLVK
jgi:hypothetical protein